MAQNFQESKKLLQLASFETFIEFAAHAHPTCNTLGGWHTSLTCTAHCRPLKLTAVSKAMPTLKVSPWRGFLAESAA